MIPGAACETCVFFSRSRPPYDHAGQCRHDPPKLSFVKDQGPRSIWPLVRAADWCGQHSVEVEVSEVLFRGEPITHANRPEFLAWLEGQRS